MRYLRELAEYSHLIWSFTQRDIRARYKQTALGISWAIIQPLSLMAVFSVVFGTFARVSSDGIPYPIFAYSGVIFWTFFATAISQGTVAMTANASLVRKIYFPRETLLFAVLLSTSLDLAIAFTILAGLMLYYKIAIAWTILYVVPLLLFQLLLTFAVISVTSTIHVYFRDVGHALSLGLQLWMFATPVAYPASMVPERYLSVYLLNPMAHVIEGYRRALLAGQAPDLVILSQTALVVLVLACLTYLLFKRAERTFADVI